MEKLCLTNRDLEKREAMSDQQRLKNGSWKDGIRNQQVYIRKGFLVQ